MMHSFASNINQTQRKLLKRIDSAPVHTTGNQSNRLLQSCRVNTNLDCNNIFQIDLTRFRNDFSVRSDGRRYFFSFEI